MTAVSLAAVDWNTIPAEQLNPLLARKFISTASITVAQFELKQGCFVPEHHHLNEQVTLILRGALKLGFGEREITLHAGQSLTIPPHAAHSAEALEDTQVIDIFSPPRDDWHERRDDYLRATTRA
jgi:quercetin dioxygenase-like cupin family protein